MAAPAAMGVLTLKDWRGFAVDMNPVKTRLPLWGGLLVLPILALGFYLDQQRPAPADVFTQQQLVVIPAQGSPQAGRVPAQLSPGEEPPASAEGAATTATASVVEPEVARQAVFGKENAVYEKATRLFEAETVDVEWASAYEQDLRAMFTSHAGLMRVSVNTISCHTSMCRIEVFTPRDTDADYFTAMFYNALDNFREGALKAEASIARRMERGMTSVYIARKGHTLGFY